MFSFGSGDDTEESNYLEERTTVRQRFARVMKDLNKKIFNNIRDYKFNNGSRVSMKAFDKLTHQERHQLYSSFDGKIYERPTTHVQYKIVWDKDNDELIVLDADPTPKHRCIHPLSTFIER
jgi:hypothetical protein